MTDKEKRLLVAVSEALHTFMMCSKEDTTRWPELRELHDALVAVKVDGMDLTGVSEAEWLKALSEEPTLRASKYFDTRRTMTPTPPKPERQ